MSDAGAKFWEALHPTHASTDSSSHKNGMVKGPGSFSKASRGGEGIVFSA